MSKQLQEEKERKLANAEILIASKAGRAPRQNARYLNPTIETDVSQRSAPEMESGVIELTISEVDRQTAQPYTDIENCLICTALRNRGLNVESVGPTFVTLEDSSDWKIEDGMGSPENLHSTFPETTAPFYRPSVVGTVIKLRKE